MMAPAIRCGLTMESTARYSKRPGAEIRRPVVRFWYPQSANTGAQNPVSHSRRYELTVEQPIAVSAPEVGDDAAYDLQSDLPRKSAGRRCRA